MGGVSVPADGSAGLAGEDVRLARAYLSRVAEPASLAVWAFVVRHGPVQAAARIRSGDVAGQVDAATSARRHSADPAADLEAADRHGIRLAVPESSEWPHFAFAALQAATRTLLQRQERQAVGLDDVPPVPPLALWVKGDAELDSLGVRSVAIVGARAATEYGQHVALQLAFGVAQRGIAVISGGAHGIAAVVRPCQRARRTHLRVAAWLVGVSAKVPLAEPVDRCLRDRHPRRGGSGSIGGSQHRQAFVGLGPAGDGRPRADHLRDVGRMP